jgi:hypothetical protein
VDFLVVSRRGDGELAVSILDPQATISPMLGPNSSL